MIDLTKIKKPFGVLSAKKKKALREYKGTIEVFDGSRWVSVDCPSFFPTCTYRAKLIKLLPEWPAGLRPEWKWIAMDEDDCVCAYQDKPEKTRRMWSDDKNHYRIDHLIPISFDGIPWKQAIIQRPEGV
jgi:hypothetical protein